MWSNTKTRSARNRKRTGYEWATRSTNIAAIPSPPPARGATLPSRSEEAPWPPRAFGTNAVTLAPDDVVEYASDEGLMETQAVDDAAPPLGPSQTPAPSCSPLVASFGEPPRTRRILRFIIDNWAFAAAFVLAGGLAWRLTFPVHPLPPAAAAIAVPSAKSTLCSGEPTTNATASSPTSPLPLPSEAASTPSAAAGRPRSTRASVKRALPSAISSDAPPPPPAPTVTQKTTPSSVTPTTPESESKRALDKALTELASY